MDAQSQGEVGIGLSNMEEGKGGIMGVGQLKLWPFERSYGNLI